MSDKKLAVLGIAAVLLAAAAIFQYRIKGEQTAQYTSAPLIEGLNIDAVEAIDVTGKQADQTVKLVRDNDRFLVSGKDNYPADASKVNNLINQCLDIRTVEKVTSNPDNFADLQVSEDTAAYKIAFLDGDDKPIVTVLVSPADSENNTAHVRLLSEDDVYTVQGSPWFNTRPVDFLDTELVNVPQSDVHRVAVKSPDSSYILTSPEGSDAIELDQIPEGKQYKQTAYKTVFNVLNSLRFEDVQAEANAPQDLVFDTTYNCRLYDLTVYKLQIAKSDDKTYVKAMADFLDKTPVEKTVGQVESDEQLKKKEAKLLAIDKVKDFNAAHQGWIYQIPSYKADQLTKPLSDLIEDIPQPTDPNAVQTTDQGASEE